MTALRDPRRKYATFRVWRATKSGLLIRPSSCSCCGIVPRPAKDGRAMIQAHHHKGYDDEFILDVEWLCASCHKLKHPNDAEALEKIAAPQRGRKRSAESIERQKRTTSGRSGAEKGWTDERRAAQSLRMKSAWTPERRAAQAERAKQDRPWLGRVV